MEEKLAFPSGLALKPPSIGAKGKKKSWMLWTKSKPIYRLIWATTAGELEGEVTRFMSNRKNVKLIGTPFHDVGWFQAVTYDGE